MRNFARYRMEKQKKSEFQRGADNGFLLGLLFIVLFSSMVLSEHYSSLSAITMALVLSVPFALYFLLRRSYRKSMFTLEYASLWMEGIVSFACAGAILALAVYLYIRLIDQDYIERMVDLGATVYSEVEGERAKDVADLMKLIKETKAYPTPRLVSLEILLSSVFTGSILTMAIALLVKSRFYKK